MSGFSVEWLTLRADADVRARSVPLETAMMAALRARRDLRGSSGGTPGPLVCVDLGTGSGANFARLATRLPGLQHWRLLDADAALLALAAGRAADGTASRVDCVKIDLATADLAGLCHGADLVTASALLDLVSTAWFERLADAVVAAHACALFVLDYDGRRECTPWDPLDVAAHAAFERHQRCDKGFGVALGAAAVEHAARAFERRGYLVRRARSDWRLDGADATLQRTLLDGWHAAACEAVPGRAAEFDAWYARRGALLDAGAAHVVVGHEDLLVLPR